MHDIKTVGIISKPGVPQAARVVPGILEMLAAQGIAVRCDEITAAYAGPGACPTSAAAG